MRIWRKKEPAAGAACSQLRWPGAEWGMLSAVRLGAQGPLYRAVRAAVPAVDAAVGKIIRLAGGVRVVCEEPEAEAALGRFLLRGLRIHFFGPPSEAFPDFFTCSRRSNRAFRSLSS